jgi:sugar (pentulose or hexulose) kinase
MSSKRLQAASGQTIDHYIAVGGGTASDLWMQILADTTGVPIHRSATKEASSLGAAIAAATGCAWFPTFTKASTTMSAHIVRKFNPRPNEKASYAKLAEIYAALWPTLSTWNQKLSRFTDHQTTKKP